MSHSMTAHPPSLTFTARESEHAAREALTWPPSRDKQEVTVGSARTSHTAASPSMSCPCDRRVTAVEARMLTKKPDLASDEF